MKKRITRLAAALTLATLATTGIALTDGLLTTHQMDTGWGAPAPTTNAITGDSTSPVSAGDNVTVTITPSDTAWG